jgi:hypothetical protein
MPPRRGAERPLTGGGRPRAVAGDRQPPHRGPAGLGAHAVDPPRCAARIPPPARGKLAGQTTIRRGEDERGDRQPPCRGPTGLGRSMGATGMRWGGGL